MFVWREMRETNQISSGRGASSHRTNFESLDECIRYDEKYFEGDRGFLFKNLTLNLKKSLFFFWVRFCVTPVTTNKCSARYTF